MSSKAPPSLRTIQPRTYRRWTEQPVIGDIEKEVVASLKYRSALKYWISDVSDGQNIFYAEFDQYHGYQ